MKFQELPEGYYFIHKVTDAVYVQKLENQAELPTYALFEYVQVVHDGRDYINKDIEKTRLNEMLAVFTTHEEQAKERKSYGAKISHVTRRIMSGERLKGKTLELALSLTRSETPNVSELHTFYDIIADKLEAGLPLTDYEVHMMVDVRLVHARF